MEERRSNFGDLLLGLIIGGFVGYIAALLSAPQSGRETRVKVAEKSREIREQAANTYQETKDKTNKLISTGRAKVGETLEQTKDRAMNARDQVVDKGETIVEEKRVQVSETLHKVADSLDPNTGQDVNPNL